MFRLTHFGSIRPTNTMSRKNPFLFAYMDFGSWLFRLIVAWSETFPNEIRYFNSAQFPPPTGGIPLSRNPPEGAVERGPNTPALALSLCSSRPSRTVTAFFRRRLTGHIMSNNNILQYKGRSFITPLITGGSW